MKRALVAGAAITLMTIAGSAGTAYGSHEHYVVREDSDGTRHCRYIAEGQTSKEPGDGGYHQFHDHVHTGQPGSDGHGTDFDRDTKEDDRCDEVNTHGQH